MSNTNKVHLETTPRVYYENYMAAVPSYDLYPNLSRRQANFVQRPTRANKQQRDFLAMNLVSSRQRWSNEEDPFWVEQPNEETPPWDLYPAILRRVENFGTEQMRQRLHALEANVRLS